MKPTREWEVETNIVPDMTEFNSDLNFVEWVNIKAFFSPARCFFKFYSAKTVLVHEHTKCSGKDELTRELKRVEALGGEGLMIRQPASKYVHGRSNTLLKIKTFHDAEVRCLRVRHAPDVSRRTSALFVSDSGRDLFDSSSFTAGGRFLHMCTERRHPRRQGYNSDKMKLSSMPP